MDRSDERCCSRRAAVLTILFSYVLAVPCYGAARSAIFLFGPGGAEHARHSAQVAASTARRWLKQPESTAELRRAGSLDSLQLAGQAPTKSVDEQFLTFAREARDSDLAALLAALDSAAQALARQPGLRVLVAVVEAPPLSGEAEIALKQIIEFCQANSVRVIILDSTEIHSKGGAAPLESLAARSGGALIREPKLLETTVLTVTAGTSAAETAAGQLDTAAPLPPLPSDLPVFTRFVRISSRGLQRFGTERHFESGRGGITETDGGANTEGTTGPTQGFLLVESPLSALHFDTDDNDGTYQARARVTQVARNASGKVVWQAAKVVTLRGPLRKLEMRRAGNLYYLREVQLPAGRYTLEATVEDLIAGKSGGAREPLNTGLGLPGFDVSDALIVRPFKGASDRFEADQVLSYDGDAIAPLLDPVYQANQPFNLQIYVIIYPDLHGAQPELSLEVLRNGRVVGRSALPFTDRIHNDATEGRGTSVVGEQKHQFPYVATLRGAKLGAGDFEARVNIRQGPNVLTRTVKFRVLGDPHAEVAGGSAPTVEPDSRVAEDESVEIALPDVDPVHLNTSGNVLPEAEQQRLWDEAAADAMSYSSRLPNFRCNRETHRLAAPIRKIDQFREADSLIEELTYENGEEKYRTLKVNGQKSEIQRSNLQGVHSRGEFGSMLKSIFRPEISARYKWAGRAMAGGSLCQVFEIEVPANKSNFVLTFNLAQAVTAYHGRVFIDEDSGLVRRITIQGSGLPKEFGLQAPTFSLDYGMVRIGDKDHLLPLRSVLQVRQGRSVVRNETLFRDYRRFEAESQIRLQ